jgi:type IV secretion system protein TrbC
MAQSFDRASRTSPVRSDIFSLTAAEWIGRGEFTPKGSCGEKAPSDESRKALRRLYASAAAKSTAMDGVILPELVLTQTSEDSMRKLYRKVCKRYSIGRCVAMSVLGLALAAPAIAQANSPWENAVNVLQQAFTSTIARGLSLVAIVVSGLTFAFGEGGSKRVLAGVLFGVGMAIAAVNFMAWLFP